MAGPDKNPHSLAHRVGFWGAATLVIALGVYLSLIGFMNSEWLTRAGCLVVMLGIWSGIGGVLQERVLFTRTKWRRRNAVTAARARLAESNTDPEDSAKQLAEINDAFDRQTADAAQHLRLSIGLLEVSLLLTGTFLWGFGDLLVR